MDFIKTKYNLTHSDNFTLLYCKYTTNILPRSFDLSVFLFLVVFLWQLKNIKMN
jgi:hypothetical protein